MQTQERGGRKEKEAADRYKNTDTDIDEERD